MNKEKFIVYGAGRIGKNIVDILIKRNIRVEMMWDKSSQRRDDYRGIPIKNPYVNNRIIEENKDINILLALASPDENETVFEFLKKKGCSNVYVYSEDGSNEVIDMLCTADNRIEENCVSCGYVEVCQKSIKQNLEKVYGSSFSENKNIVKSLFLLITNRCTLNCKCCANCTEQVIQTRNFYDLTLEDVKKCMCNLFEEIDYIHQLIVSGGELLLHKQLPQILEYLCDQPKIGFIRVLTTGTVKVPASILSIIKNPKIICVIDDYGMDKHIPERLYSNLAENIRLLEEENVIYSVLDNSDGTWYDLGGYEKRSGINENNTKCMFRSCLVISPKGNLSWCSRNVSSMECGLTPEDKRDYCNLLEEQEVKRIKDILELKYLHACEYCNGTDHKNLVPAGMQIRSFNQIGV